MKQIFSFSPCEGGEPRSREGDAGWGHPLLGTLYSPSPLRGESRDSREGNNTLGLLATALLAPIAAMLIQAAISRQREFAADRRGAEIVGSPLGLAQALRRIEATSKRVPLDANPATAHMFIMSPFSGGGLLSLFSTHPPTDARIQKLLGHA